MPGEIGPPSLDELISDLRVVREKGIGNLRRHATPALDAACELLHGVAPEQATRPAAVEGLLRRAAEKIGGGKEGEAAKYTLGLVEGTRLWNATERRRRAASTQGVSVERFRKGYESVLLEQVAESILVLLYEKRNKEAQSAEVGAEPPLHPALSSGGELSTASTRLAARLNEAGVASFHFSRGRLLAHPGPVSQPGAQQHLHHVHVAQDER